MELLARDFTRSAPKHGLKLHPNKTQNTLKRMVSNKENGVEIEGVWIEILPPEGKTTYLGLMIPFKNSEAVEIGHRLRCVW